ncbi:MAG: aminopeptidase P N-terminal domain-containing protein [Thermoanaerobaculaceae bacterium]|nr:aminopeptidase P N-terminal domain-containing protein [Thermoanaerobaculaceae bacterium]TAM52718.1 MAG: M24 family metallopeptidase [Acidobacteriota bacterium]
MIEERVFRGGQYAAEVEPPEAYRARRESVRARLEPGDVAVVLGASDARGYGDVGTFRQEPGFFYLTGVELPGAVLLLAKEHEALLLPARRPALEAWTGPKFGPGEEAALALGFAEVGDRDATEAVVDARRRGVPGYMDRIAGALQAGGALWVVLGGSATGELTPEQRMAQGLRDRLPSFAVRDLAPVLADLRLRKSSGEIALLRKAVAATVAAMRAAAATVGPGRTEGEVEGAAFAALRAAGAEGWSFPPIVGSGQAGCVLHYDANLGVLGDGELVVVDIGARHGYYCGDLTRTFPASGAFTPRQRQLYGAVLGAYEAAAATLKPGSTIAAARKAAFAALEGSAVAGDGGRTLGNFFIHGLGHFLGLEAHDAGGEGPVLEAGMVVTVEPGVYLPAEGVGIRVEDDYLITDGGAENLSAGLPRDAAAVEAMVARR